MISLTIHSQKYLLRTLKEEVVYDRGETCGEG